MQRGCCLVSYSCWEVRGGADKLDRAEETSKDAKSWRDPTQMGWGVEMIKVSPQV